MTDGSRSLVVVRSGLSGLPISFKGELILHHVPRGMRDVLVLFKLAVGLSIAARQSTHIVLPLLPADAHSSGVLIASTSVILRVSVVLALVNAVQSMLGMLGHAETGHLRAR